MAFLALRVPFRGSPVPITLLSPLDHGLLWPTSPCPGCPLLSTHLSTATLTAGQWTPAPFKQVSCLRATPTKKPTSILVNLANPRTNVTLTPGSLGWDSFLPPIIHSHHAFHIHSTHTWARCPKLTHCISFFLILFFISHITP